jgi:hypothetical protein
VAALVSGLLLLIPVHHLQQRTIAVGSRITGAQRKIFSTSDELLRGMKLAKVHAVEARQRRTYQRLQSSARLW